MILNLTALLREGGRPEARGWIRLEEASSAKQRGKANVRMEFQRLRRIHPAALPRPFSKGAAWLGSY